MKENEEPPRPSPDLTGFVESIPARGLLFISKGRLAKRLNFQWNDSEFERIVPRLAELGVFFHKPKRSRAFLFARDKRFFE